MNSVFLNVDLEIKTSEQPIQLEKEFTNLGALNLYSGIGDEGYLSTFEVNPDRDTPDQIIAEFHKLIKQLSENAKREWNDAHERIFDMGFESFDEVTLSLNEQTSKLIKELGAVIKLTTYQPSDT